MRPRPYRLTPKNADGMTKFEVAWMAELELRRQAGTILRYRFEPVTFRLAERTTYTPDFEVVTVEHIEFHEVKGFWEERARVKWKVAAEQNREFKFRAVKGDGWSSKRGRPTTWTVETYGETGKVTL